MFGDAGAVENAEDAKPERIAADEVIAHQPRGHDGGVEEENEQSADRARAEPREDEGEEPEENPGGERLGEGHEPEEQGGAGEGEQHAPGLLFLAGVHGAVDEPEGAGEKEQEEHLRQTGDREAPQKVGQQDQAGRHPRDAGIEERADEEKEDEDRGEEDREARGGDGQVADVDHVGRLHRPPAFDGAEDDGVENGVEREIIRVGHEALGQRFAVVEELPHGERADVERGVAGARGNLAPELRVVHGGLRIEPAEVDEEIDGGQTGHGGHEERAENEGLERSDFDAMDEFLNLSVFLVDHARTGPDWRSI